jgi:hypothetical protein
MSTAGKILIQDEDSATIGPYTVKRFDENYPCQFDLKKGNDKLAEINFNLLTEKVEEAPTLNGSSYGVAVYGQMGAVCWRGYPSQNGSLLSKSDVGSFGSYRTEIPKEHVCAAGLQTLFWTPTEVFVLQDALTYIFDNHICEPS